MLNNLKIRNKLAAILALPVLAMLILASIGYRERNVTARATQHDQGLITLSQKSATLISAIQQEGYFSVALVSPAQSPEDKTVYRAHLLTARKAVDTAVTAFNAEAKRLTVSSGSGVTGDIANVTSSSSPQVLKGLRDQINNGGMTFDQASDAFSHFVNQPLLVVQALAAGTKSLEVSPELRGISAYLSYVQADTVLNYAYIGVVAGRTFEVPLKLENSAATSNGNFATPAVGLSTVTNLINERTSSLNVVDNATQQQAAQVQEGSTLQGTDSTMINIATASDNGANADSKITAYSASKLANEAATYGAALSAVAATNLSNLGSQTSKKHSNSVFDQQLYVLLAGLVILAAVLLALVVARTITQRVHKLTVAADKLSNEQLPRLVDSLKNPAEDDVGYLTSSFTDVEVGGTDEIGRLASSFNRIQGVAVDVATEQAQLLRKGIGDMFVNLARRNQGLLDRQIEFIDQLESSEEDPDQLENLFRLDHLATRMRRNAESLLVLAGAEPNRRRGRPVPLADVVRAAVGEVEDFARIDMLQFDDVLVASNAALDIAHLLSELMENAANFSPPDSRVEVVGHRTKADGYVVSIADHGIGMSADQIAESNDMLSRPPLVGLALSRSLGFIVIGRLAARFGIAVRLMPSPSGGTTSMVSLPSALITDQPRVASGPSSLPLSTEGNDQITAPPVLSPSANTNGGSHPPLARRTSPPEVPAAPKLSVRTPADQAEVADVDVDASAKDDGAANGLTKRVPRRAGATRAVPGGESERVTSKNRRSPEEVRSMLSRYRTGIERGRTDESAGSAPEEEK